MRRAIDTLGLPAKPFRLTGHGWFEKRAFARAQDRERIRGCRVAIKVDGNAPRPVRRLLKKLEKAQGSGKAPKSLASSVHMRRLRNRVIGQILALIERGSFGRVARFDGVPRGWEFTPEEIDGQDPRKLMARVRKDLYEAGAKNADGWLIAFIHGEHEPECGIYRVHYHGVAAGGMIDVLRALKALPKYQNRAEPDGSPDPVKCRLRVSRKPISNLPYRVAYILKSYFTCRRLGPVGREGKVKRARRSQRIPEPHHSWLLAWLDQWRLQDMALIMKLSVTSDGLRLSKSKYRNDAQDVRKSMTE
jgi:hypothetical protein